MVKSVTVYAMQRYLQEIAPTEASLSIRSVQEFPSPRLEPLCYPGVRPQGSFTTGEGYVYPVTTSEAADGPHFDFAASEGGFNLNDALDYYGVARMEDRFPIVGFGSNACPGQLCEKFSVAQDTKNEIQAAGDHHIIPTLRGSMRDVAAAYSSKLGVRGYIFAELIQAPEVEAEVFVNFLSEGQLQRMVRSERAYSLCDIGEVAIDGLAKTITAFGFAGKNNVVLDTMGEPILLQSMSQKELLHDLAKDFGPQLDEQYPHAPVFANSATNLMALMSYRQEFLRRTDTANLAYKHHPADGEQPDPLIGVVLQELLLAAGRVADDKLLDHLPASKQNIKPATFWQLY